MVPTEVFPMSNNEILQLDANFTDWKATSGAGLTGVEPFLYYSVDHILKNYNLPVEDVKYGITDHPNDGGIDAFYILANRNTVVRDGLEIGKSGTDRLRIILFQSKSSESETGYKAEDIGKFTRFIDDLLDLSKDASKFHYKYEGHLVTIMNTFKNKYLEIAGNFPKVQIDFYYVTKGDETTTTKVVQDSINELSAMIKKHLGDSTSTFYPVNTQALLGYIKKRKQKVRQLKWAGAVPLPIGAGYVGLVYLREWYEFLKDENGDLDELIFESNVRGYRGNSAVNRQLRETLDKADANFWQLNNGITLISSNKLQPIDSMNLNIEDPQVVNGLQTSRTVFRYYQAKKPLTTDERSVLVRVLQISDEGTRNAVIRATNSQNSMQPSALRGTDNIHRQIEDLFKKYGFFYDRRPGFYRDQGAPIEKIIGYTELIQAVICLLLHRPDDARGRPGDYIKLNKKGDMKYASIFQMDASGSAKQPLGFYLKVVQIVRKVDEFLEAEGVQRGDLNNLSFYVAFYVCAVMTQKTNPNADSIMAIESTLIGSELKKVYPIVSDVYKQLAKAKNLADDNRDAVAKGTEFLKELRALLANQNYPQDAAMPKEKKKRKVKDVIKKGKVT